MAAPLFLPAFAQAQPAGAPVKLAMIESLSGAVNIEFNGIGHVALGMHPRVLREVIAAIRQVPAG